MVTPIRAAVARQPDGPFSFEELVLDDPRPDELRVRILASGVCHTDIAMRRATDYTSAGWVFGHEGAGLVEEVGSAVRLLTPGDLVALSFRSCGACPRCVLGLRAYCDQILALNFSGLRADGTSPMTGSRGPVRGSFFGQSSFASSVLVSEDNAVRMPAGTDPSLLAPFGCSVQTGAGAVLTALGVTRDDSFIVYGAGAVGLVGLLAARMVGAADVVAVEPLAARRSLALELGATAVVDPADDDAAEQILDVTDGGPTHALDTTGSEDVAVRALDALRPRGALVIVGIGPTSYTLPSTALLTAGKSVRGCIEGDAEPQVLLPQLLAWQRSGDLPVERLITTYPFEDIDRAVADARSGSTVKPVLVLDRS